MGLSFLLTIWIIEAFSGVGFIVMYIRDKRKERTKRRKKK